jgi:glycosyltransferase involved in cell wall biosynthesis
MICSIIVPVYQDQALRAALAGLQQLDYPRADYEVIVVENGKKTDWIEAAVYAAGGRYLYAPVAGSYSARNLGAAQAIGEILAFTDSDCVVDAHWLQTITVTLQAETIAGVMGLTRGQVGQNRVAAYEQQMYEANLAGFTDVAQLRRIDTRNFAIKRSVFTALGGFNADLRFGGDMEYGARAHAAGYNLVYAPQLTASHANLEHLGVLLKKRVKQNAANLVLRKHHDTDFVRKYFPQLLRYQAGLLAQLLCIIYGSAYTLLKPISQPVCLLLPPSFGYVWFKSLNVIAIRFGMLKGVLQSVQ